MWKIVGFSALVKPLQGIDAISLFAKAMETLKVVDLEFFVFLSWEMWNYKNNVSICKPWWSPEDLWSGVEGTWRTFGAAMVPSSMAPHAELSSWSASARGMVSACVDAATINEVGSFGMWCIICDHEGKVVCFEISSKFSRLSPVLSEDMAILYGLSLARHFGRDYVVVKLDCMEVVMAVKKGIIPAKELGTILKDMHGCS